MKTLITKDSPGVEIIFDPQHEDIQPEDIFLSPDDADYIQKIYDACENSYFVEPMWFCSKVSVTFEDYEEDDYLGCCSYKSFEDFQKPGDYYEDMVNNCIEAINKDISYENRITLQGYLKRLSKLTPSLKKSKLKREIKDKLNCKDIICN